MNKTKLALFECNDYLTFCSMLHLISFALTNNAIVDYQSIEAIYNVSFRNEIESLQFR